MLKRRDALDSHVLKSYLSKMGNNQIKSDLTDSTSFTISRNAFQMNYIIGTGGFGRVWKAEFKKSHQPYAMKEMSKVRIVQKRSVHSVMNERAILEKLNNPFIVNMHFAFQDRAKLYLVMDLLSGGDLRYHIGRLRKFNEAQSKFIAACIITGLEYIHANGVIHRDLKPENLVLDSRGYVRITDFGVARLYSPNNAKDTSGTPGYMAPEVICRNNHSYSADYFALGVMMYEFMLGRRPYIGKSRAEIRDRILSKQVQVSITELPIGWSYEAADFVNRLIQRKPANRLGHNGIREIKSHPWLKDFPWKSLYDKMLDAPFKPASGDNFSKKHFSEIGEDDAQEVQMIPEDLFLGYEYRIHLPTASFDRLEKRETLKGHRRNRSFI